MGLVFPVSTLYIQPSVECTCHLSKLPCVESFKLHIMYKLHNNRQQSTYVLRTCIHDTCSIFYPWIFALHWLCHFFTNNWLSLIHVILWVCVRSVCCTWVYHVTLHVQLLLQLYLQCWLTLFLSTSIVNRVHTMFIVVILYLQEKNI